MNILLTGAAGFIGYHTCERLLARGDRVLGLDNLNSYYPVSLKQARLARLRRSTGFRFSERDVARREAMEELADTAADTDLIVHLAAQAGVRYSNENPFAYADSNVVGQVAIFELAHRLPRRPPVVYASSSSVYGESEPVPFRESAAATSPVSVYAATKRAGELLAQAFSATRGTPSVGLRFFTVYGRYGRPDMAPWIFTDAILAGRPISVFNNGAMERDFTHVDDIVSGVVGACDRVLADPAGTAPIYNLGNNRPVALRSFIAAIEAAAGRPAIMDMRPKPAGDVVRTCADITLAKRDLGYRPTIRIDDGMADFVKWFRGYSAGGG
jgi:UDP-glucuronate 4-epimerase